MGKIITGGNISEYNLFKINIDQMSSDHEQKREEDKKSSSHHSSSSSSSSSSDSSSDRDRRQRRGSRDEDDHNGVVPLKDQDEIPIKYEDRNCTDVCCLVVGIAFTLIMAIISFSIYDYDTYVKSSFPTDSDGRLCGVDAPAYPLVYFASPPEIGRRVCVSSCPSEGDIMLGCFATSDVGCRFSDSPMFGVSYYESQADVGRIGSFCLPTDESLREELLINAKLQQKNLFMNSIDVIQLCMLFSIGLSAVFLCMVQCCSKTMVKASIYMSFLVLLGLIICLFIYPTDHPAKVPIAIIILILFILLICSVATNRHEIAMFSIFMEQTTKILKDDRCCVFSYILLFWAFTFGFLMLLIWEFQNFWGGGQITFDKEKSVFWEFEGAGSTIFTVLLAIQGYWGLCFLKEASNYVISGNIVAEYFQEKDWGCFHPMKTLVLKHFGSVIGGSFMTGFFGFGDFTFDILKNTCCLGFLETCCMCCLKLFELVRSDSMPYINITGIPFCNASRTCEYLSNNTVIMKDSQCASRVYRLCSHILLVGIVCILALYIKGNISPMALLVVFAFSFFIVTFCISIHADAADALIVSFLLNEEWEKRKILEKDPVFNPNDKEALKGLNMKNSDLKDEIQKLWEEREKDQNA